MADELDHSADQQQAERERGIAAAGAAGASIGSVVIGFCEACADDDVPVRPCGGMPRCTDCRTRWERRK